MNYRLAARQAAVRHGLDPNVFERQIGQESSFNPNARSKYAVGIAQFTPDTARAVGVDPMHPLQALDAAAKLMAGYVKKYGGIRNALIAYNAGPGAVGSAKLPTETLNYIDVILGGKGGGGSAPAPQGYGLKGGGQVTMPGAPTFKPGGQQTDVDGALMDALLQHRGGGLLKSVGAALDSGQYTSTAPGQWQAGTVAKTPGPVSASGLTAKGPPGKPVMFDGKPVAPWIAEDLQYARAHGWDGTVSSGYRTVAEQKAIYDSGVRPAAKPGQSNHNFLAFPGGAVDVTQAAQLAAILARKPGGAKLVWAGAKDPVHFSHPHNGGY